jgi:hypothetical protein
MLGPSADSFRRRDVVAGQAASPDRATPVGADLVPATLTNLGLMAYTGEVSVGGSADVRELPDAVIRKISVSEMDNNCYLVTCRATGEQLLVDAADDAPRLLALVAEGASHGGAGLARVVTTHRHWDHHRALAEVVAATGAPVAAGREDAPSCRSRRTSCWTTATACRSATCGSTSFTSAGTRPGRSPSC